MVRSLKGRARITRENLYAIDICDRRATVSQGLVVLRALSNAIVDSGCFWSDATLTFGLALGTPDAKTGYQSAVTPPWAAIFSLLMCAATIAVIVASWRAFCAYRGGIRMSSPESSRTAEVIAMKIRLAKPS
jgi:hypothetical protein